MSGRVQINMWFSLLVSGDFTNDLWQDVMEMMGILTKNQVITSSTKDGLGLEPKNKVYPLVIQRSY